VERDSQNKLPPPDFGKLIEWLVQTTNIGAPVGQSSKTQLFPAKANTTEIETASGLRKPVAPDPQDPEGIKQMLRDMETNLKLLNGRSADPAVILGLIRDARNYGIHAGPLAAKSNADLMEPLHKDRDRTLRAFGMSDDEIHHTDSTNWWSGLFYPTGSAFTNLLNFVAAPAVSVLAGDPWGGVYFALLVVAITAHVDAFQQSGIVSYCDLYRERNAYTVAIQTSMIHSAHWPLDTARELHRNVDEFAEVGGAWKDTFADIHKTVDPHSYSEHAAPSLTRMKNVLKACNPEQRQRLIDAYMSFTAAGETMEKTQRNLLMTQGAWEVDWVANKPQIVSRSLRTVGSTAVAFGEAAAAALASGTSLGTSDASIGSSTINYLLRRAAETVNRVARYTPAQAVGVQAGVTSGFQLMQMREAAQGDQDKFAIRHFNHILYGKVFTPEGERLWANGEKDKLQTEHLDMASVNAMLLHPDQARIRRIIRYVREESMRSPAQSSTLDNEIRLLEEGKLSELDPGGFSAGLLHGNLGGFLFSSFTKAEIKSKYSTPGEFQAQTGQRLGQVFHLLGFGRGVSSLVGKVTTAITHGAENELTQVIIGLMVLGGVLAFIGAFFFSIAIKIKDWKRDNIRLKIHDFGNDTTVPQHDPLPTTKLGKLEIPVSQAIKGGGAAVHYFQAARASSESTQHMARTLENLSDAVKLADHFREATSNVVPLALAIEPQDKGKRKANLGDAAREYLDTVHNTMHRIVLTVVQRQLLLDDIPLTDLISIRNLDMSIMLISGPSDIGLDEKDYNFFKNELDRVFTKRQAEVEYFERSGQRAPVLVVLDDPELQERKTKICKFLADRLTGDQVGTPFDGLVDSEDEEFARDAQAAFEVYDRLQREGVGPNREDS
jgi:hypothetical protein